MRKDRHTTTRRWPAAVLVLAVAPFLFSSGQPVESPTVRIGVFGLFRPQELVLRPAPGATVTIELGGSAMSLAGGQSAHLRLMKGGIECRGAGRRLVGKVLRARSPDAGEFQLAVPNKIERHYRGSLGVTASGGSLQPVITMDVETAVASAVAAESPPGAPLEALRAQAVVARSYYVAGRGRHSGFDFCDTTHCQFLRHPPEEDDPAWLATAATRGLVLSYQGEVLPALYSASCGGRTLTLAEAGLRSDGYPYFSVACPEHAKQWERRLSAADAERVVSAKRIEASRLEIGRRLGWDALPGNSYVVEENGDEVVLHGRGLGHGVGFCQQGASVLGAEGASFREILQHYYPSTEVIPARP
ncbi:MAG TPA: SpoIID/LytB domain-containing protein [Terriglobales bacterium]|nr:SpoIID/LytB domain-containing protein [Terriglobales bacterium]